MIQVDVCSFAKNFTECLNIGPGFLYDISKMRLCEVSKYNSVLADMSGHAVSVLKIECMDRHSVHLQNQVLLLGPPLSDIKEEGNEQRCNKTQQNTEINYIIKQHVYKFGSYNLIEAFVVLFRFKNPSATISCLMHLMPLQVVTSCEFAAAIIALVFWFHVALEPLMSAQTFSPAVHFETHFALES